MVGALANPMRRTGEKAILCLDRAVHPGTDQAEVLSSIDAFRRLTNGATLTLLCEQLYGTDAAYMVELEDQWEDRFAQQAAEIATLKANERRLRRELDAALARLATQSVSDAAQLPERCAPDILDLTDAQWAAVEPLLSPRSRKPIMRARIAAALWVVRGGGTWRGVRPDSKSGWTTAYNTFRAWRATDLWDKIVAAIDAATPVCDKPGVDPI
jgi:hypothetical protein